MTRPGKGRAVIAFLIPVLLVSLLSCAMVTTAAADDKQASANEAPQPDPNDVHRGVVSDGPEDPENLLPAIQRRRAQKNSLFPVSPLRRLEDWTTGTSNVEQIKRAKEIIDAVGRPVVTGAEAIKYLDIPFAATRMER